MSSLRQILMLKHRGSSNKEVQRLLGHSKTTILKYVHAASASGQSYAELLSLGDDQLASALFGSAAGSSIDPKGHQAAFETFFPYAEGELQKVGVTRKRLWKEYLKLHPGGLSYSRFCNHFRKWSRAQQAVMYFEHKGGDKLFIDFAGKKLVYTDWKSGEEMEVEVFVATLGASQYTYVEACEDQKSATFLACVEHSLAFIAGVPCAIVSDNLKAAVSKSSQYEPTLNQSFEAFGNHYGTALLATRPYKPREKSLVENAVKQVYHVIYAELRHRTFTSLTEINEAIRLLLPTYNGRSFQGKDYNRIERYKEIDLPALAPLRTERFVLKHYRRVTVQKNCHIYLGEDKHYYSVPYRYIGQKVKVIYSRDQVEIYLRHQRIAYHLRDKKAYGYTSQAEHLPSEHRYVSSWKPEKFLEWAEAIGEPVVKMISGVLESRPHPEQAYKSCSGILNLARKVGKERLVKACERAISYHSYSYRSLKGILDQGLEEQSPTESPPTSSHIPEHSNIRGQDYYQ